MAYRTDTRLDTNAFDRVSLRVTTKVNAADANLDAFNSLATLTIRTGACDLQTYLRADQCRTLACGLLAAAADLERIAIDVEPIPAGETVEVQ